MIYIQTLDRYWNPSIKLLEGASKKEISAFQKYLAKEFIRLFKLSIDKQRYRAKWVELTPGYLEYKRRHGLSTNIWEATGQLKSSIRLFKIGRYNYSIGFDKRRVHVGSKAKLHNIARWLEYGTMRMPPRPLFRLIYRYMSSNISYFYDKYLKEGGSKL